MAKFGQARRVFNRITAALNREMDRITYKLCNRSMDKSKMVKDAKQ